MINEKTTYLMEDEREAGRLSAKVDAEAWVRKYLTPHVRPGMRVLEVGCGPGHLATELSKEFPECEVVGVDLVSERFASTIVPDNLALVEGEANALALDSDTYDIVYCRLLLEYLLDPQGAIIEFARVTKPGGLVLLQDLDGQLLWHYPIDDQLASGLREVIELLAQTGFDPHVGRKLFTFAYRAGFEQLGATVESYHLYAGIIAPLDEALWRTKLDIAMNPIRRMLQDEEKAEGIRHGFIELLRSPESFTYSNVITITGRKPFADSVQS